MKSVFVWSHHDEDQPLYSHLSTRFRVIAASPKVLLLYLILVAGVEDKVRSASLCLSHMLRFSVHYDLGKKEKGFALQSLKEIIEMPSRKSWHPYELEGERKSSRTCIVKMPCYVLLAIPSAEERTAMFEDPS